MAREVPQSQRRQPRAERENRCRLARVSRAEESEIYRKERKGRKAAANAALPRRIVLGSDTATFRAGCSCRGDRPVADDVESPAFYGTLQVIESLGMRALEIPTDPRNGIILDALALALRRQKIKACLFVLNFGNPLGSCMPDSEKKALVELLARREVPLIEDDIYGDLYFGEKRPRTAKAYDKQGLVLLCSSFSKTLAPGYRVGWTAPGRFKLQVESLKFTSSMATTTAPQMAIADFLQSGGYERYLRKLRRILMTQVQQMSNGVGRYFPAGTKVTRPQGGYVIWVELPQGVDSLELHRRAMTQKISIAPGPIFSAKQRYKNFIRLSCGLPWSDRIESAVQTLAELIRKIQ